MWQKELIHFLLNQGALGFAVICLGYVVVLFYKEIRESSKIINKLSTDATKYIQENTNQLVELREDIKEDRTNNKEMNKRMIEILEFTLRDLRK